jgi:hypothetical protein
VEPAQKNLQESEQKKYPQPDRLGKLGPELFSCRYQITPEGYAFALRMSAAHSRLKIKRSRHWLLRIGLPYVLLLLLVALAIMYGRFGADFSWALFTFFVFVLIGVAIAKLDRRKLRQTWMTAVGPFPIDMRLSVHELGIEMENDHGAASIRWRGVAEVYEQANYVTVVIKPTQIFLIPFSAFESPHERSAFLSAINSHLSPDKPIKVAVPDSAAP